MFEYICLENEKIIAYRTKEQTSYGNSLCYSMRRSKTQEYGGERALPHKKKELSRSYRTSRSAYGYNTYF